MTEVSLDIPRAEWVTSNMRLHWRSKAARVKQLRARARSAGMAVVDVPTPCKITATIGYPTARRADPSNAEPTIKALIDGLVDAGVIPDDDHAHVPEVRYRRDPDKSSPGMYRVTLRLEPIGDDA